ncbi:ABC transporter permease [Phytoactinopolyspora mesophila]|uniref:ABC transporter permease n=1 Tax=Phytoactinopolyspora mesophila TaxID=2650750 RepID=A0A7K3M832_9ACTN|nr:ABC transporter permease [Phytoactinopolyspora mesophila]NDL58558.1 ABC transporter permease [Phytoactinopolyspora mesophila]
MTRVVGWLRRVVPTLVALGVALVVTALFILIIGENPLRAVGALFDFGDTSVAQANSIGVWINRAAPLFLAGLAVSIGFRMGLFNIGVEGQYRVATVVAAGVGAAIVLPAPLHVFVIVIAAMAAGAAYAAIPAVLKVTRGVSEVISTIMLNAIAIGLVAWLVRVPFVDPELGPGEIVATRRIEESGHFPGLNELFGVIGLEEPRRPVHGFVIVAIVVGIIMAIVLSRARFGFELRASGLNALAATANGISSKAMILKAMLLSGALAGLVGLPDLLGSAHRFHADSFVAGYGFTGIAVALLGRNRPVGIAFAALLFAFLDRAGPSLQSEGIPPAAVTIMQGIVVLSVLIVDEVARRGLLRREERRARNQDRDAVTEEVPS